MKNRTSVLKNIGYLYGMQGINQLVPVITVPYLLRTIGLEKFGLLCFAYAYTRFFAIITNFGFHLTGTQIISRWREDKNKLSEAFFAIIAIKFVLLLCCLLVFILTLYAIPLFEHHRDIYLISFIAVVGNLLHPDWYFMGIEAMKRLSTMHIIARLFCLAGLISCVSSDTDFRTAVFFQSSVELVCGVLSLGVVKFSKNVSFCLPPWATIKATIVDSWHVFTSQVYVTLFGGAHTFVLGLFASSEIVGAFATGEKVVRAVTGLIHPISSAVYPRVCKMLNESLESSLFFLRKILFSGGTLFFILSCTLFIGAHGVAHLISEQPAPEVSFAIKMMSFIPLTIFIDNIYGTQILLSLSMKKEFANAILHAGIFSVIASFIFVPIFETAATATICLCSQILVMILMIVAVHKKGITLIPVICKGGHENETTK